jgi:hypothetical protein
MADPISTGLGVVGIAGSIMGAGAEAKAAREEGAAKAAMYQYQAGMSRFNARIARENKDYSLHAGSAETVLYGLKARQAAGALEVAQSATGIDVDSGSFLAARESQAFASDLDRSMILHNAARKAYAYEMEAKSKDMEAGLYEMAAQDAQRAGDRKAKASIISGVTSVSGKFLQGRQMGIFK